MPFQIFFSLSFPLTVRKRSEQIFATATLLFEKNKSTNIVSIKLISSIDKFAKTGRGQASYLFRGHLIIYIVMLELKKLK